MENNKKKLQIPSTCALLFMLMIVCAILTWIVPADVYKRQLLCTLVGCIIYELINKVSPKNLPAIAYISFIAILITSPNG